MKTRLNIATGYGQGETAEAELHSRTLQNLNKALHGMLAPPAEAQPAAARGRASVGRDLAAALALVRASCETVKIAEQRIEDARARAQELVERAEDELAVVEAQVRTLEAQLRAVEARSAELEMRSREAEQRAREAESWLERLHGALAESKSSNTPVRFGLAA